MSFGNTLLWLGGFLAESAVFYFGMLSVRRVTRTRRRRRRPPIRMTATVGRELPAPPRKELSR
jgi:hypothetical protein